MWEIGNKQQIVEKTVFSYPSLIGINEERDLGEGIKRYANRENDIQCGKGLVSNKIDGIKKEICVFEISEQQ
jgi:hypothetical protein